MRAPPRVAAAVVLPGDDATLGESMNPALLPVGSEGLGWHELSRQCCLDSIGRSAHQWNGDAPEVPPAPGVSAVQNPARPEVEPASKIPSVTQLSFTVCCA